MPKHLRRELGNGFLRKRRLEFVKGRFAWQNIRVGEKHKFIMSKNETVEFL